MTTTTATGPRPRTEDRTAESGATGSPDRFEVQEFDGSAAEWDDFVRGRRGWTHFHLYGWRRVVRGVYGHDCSYLAARDPEGELAGVLPLVRVRSVLFGHFLVSMPFFNYGGPLGEEGAVRRLARAAERKATREDVDLLELRSREPRPLSMPVSHRKITVVLDLPESGDPGELWDDFDGSVRNQVRKPRKRGVEVRFGPGELGPFYSVFSRHMRDLGTPAQPRRLFETIARVFPDAIRFGCAYLDGEPVAGACGFRWRDEVELTWASALFDYRSTAANMLLYWRFMERSIEEGASLFNFGRCTPGSGTHQFKQQWGSRDEKLWWYQHSEGDVDATPSPDDDGYAWGPRVWRRLPLSIANVLGPRIVRYIP